MANFQGFPKELITFFANLKQNNSLDLLSDQAMCL